MIHGRYCSLLMCFTLSLAAQNQAKSVKFGTDPRMHDVLVNVNGKKIPGELVDQDPEGNWKINFRYESNRGTGTSARLSQGELLLSERYSESDIETNLRFLNQDDIDTLSEEHRALCDKLFKIEEEYAEMGSQREGPEEFENDRKKIWRKLLPILFKTFTTVKVERRREGQIANVIPVKDAAGSRGYSWHSDAQTDMGFTMGVDSTTCFEGSPLIYWPGKTVTNMEETERVLSDCPETWPLPHRAMTITFQTNPLDMFKTNADGKIIVDTVAKHSLAYNKGLRGGQPLLQVGDHVITTEMELEGLKTIIEPIKWPSQIEFKFGDNSKARTHEDMLEWCEKFNMKIAPKGTKIALFEGGSTVHARPHMPFAPGKKTSRTIAFYPRRQVSADTIKRELSQVKTDSPQVRNTLSGFLAKRLGLRIPGVTAMSSPFP